MKWPMRWSGDLAARPAEVEQTEVNVGVGSAHLKAHVLRPVAPLAAVICAHPGATHELPPHEYELAHMLGAAGFATMLVGLATPEEHQLRMHLDVPLLAERLITLTRWLSASGASAQLPLGYLGVGDAAASALVATAMDPHQVLALVARSSRPERAGMSLMLTRAPTLFIVGEDQSVETVANRVACRLAPHARLEVVPSVRGEAGGVPPGLALSAAWFARWLSPGQTNAWVDGVTRSPLGA
jgi:putative phosphoribosyl transferase